MYKIRFVLFPHALVFPTKIFLCDRAQLHGYIQKYLPQSIP